MSAYVNLSTFALSIDAGGVSETRPLAFSFANDPVILGGDTLAASPAPTLTQVNVPSEAALTLGSASLSGSIWTANVSVTGGTTGNAILVCCRATTTAGRVLLAQVNVVLAGPG